MSYCQPKPQRGTAMLERRKRRLTKADDLREAYALVDARDGGVCRVTGRYTVSGAPDARVRREHHHLRGRRVRPEWRSDADRIILVCAEAHQLIEGGFLTVEGDNAAGVLRFHWNGIRPSERPFAIKSRRWSQNEDED